jgi:iron complex outermembrane receptor protein
LNDFSFNQNPPIALYINEVYKGNPAIFGISMYDLDHVEVLRGPQGTLFGKNTTGGAISFITHQPDIGADDGYQTFGIGNYRRFEAQGGLSIPIADNLAARLAYTTTQADGWFRSETPGIEDKNGIQNYSLRGALKFVASNTLQFTLTGQYGYSNPTNYGIYAQPIAPGIGGPPYSGYNYLEPNGTVVVYPSNVAPDPRTGLGPRQLTESIPDHRNDGASSLTFAAVWDVTSALKLSSITSWDYGTIYDPEDSSGSKVQNTISIYHDRDRQVTEDIHLVSNFSGPFNFTAGTYFDRETLFNSNNLGSYLDIDYNRDGVLNYKDCAQSLAANAINPNITVIGCSYDNRFHQTKDSYAAYADASYDLTTKLKLHLGIRETFDDGRLYDFKSVVTGTDGVQIQNVIPGGPNLDATLTNRFQMNKATGRAGLDYDFSPDTMAYASYNTGYRGAAFNAQAFFQPAEANIAAPELITAYEVGFKSQFMDHRITANSAVFLYDYRNQQVLEVNPVTAAQTLNGIPRSRIKGWESEIKAVVTPAVRLNFGVGFADARVTEDIYSGVNIAGNSLIAAPKWTGTAGLDWRALSGRLGELNVHVDGQYASRQNFDILNYPTTEQGGYGLLNSNIAWTNPSGHMVVTFWGRNLTNKLYAASIGDLSQGFNEIVSEWGPPLTYGVTFTYKVHGLFN